MTRQIECMMCRAIVAALIISTVIYMDGAAAAVQGVSKGQPAPPAQAQTQKQSSTPADSLAVDPKWLDRLPDEDRAAADAMLGFAPPPLTKELKWFETPGGDWNQWRGKVVVIQAWTTANAGARNWPTRLATALKEIDPKDLVIIALHTPEKADDAENFMKRQKPPESVKVVIDPSGEFCDAFGVYKHPVNFILDRNGMVRYAGLNLNGVKSAVAELVPQAADPRKIPAARSVQKTADTKTPGVEYPPIQGSVSGANDLRGKRGPEFVSDQWFNTQPQAAGKVVVVTFWSSIDDPVSFSTHAQLNNLAVSFGDRACVTAIAGDSGSKFDTEILRRRLSKSDFKYGMALDRDNRMANAMGVRAAPYSIVLSSDWTVRWQGRPGDLRMDIVQQIINADAANANDAVDTPGPKQRGWKSPAA